MRLGYSMLLGEHRDAEHVDYVDCKELQIVCPACHEPVFKVEREQRHYLSHYERAVALAALCELRVAQFDRQHLASAAAAARGQKLKLFLSVIQEALYTHPTVVDEVAYRAEHRKAARSRSWRKLSSVIRRELSRPCHRFNREQFDRFVDLHLADLNASSAFKLPQGTFALQTQKRIAYDVFKHLLTPAAITSWSVLATSALLSFRARCRVTESLPRRILTIFAATEMVLRGPREGERACRMLEQIPNRFFPDYDGTEPDKTLLSTAVAWLADEAWGLLVTIPYLKILRERRS